MTAPPVRRRWSWRLAAHLALVLIGLGIVAWPFTVGPRLPQWCREVVMGPGDVCTKADGSAQQTFEDRLDRRRTAVPVVVVGGLALTGFGLVLVRGELRRLGRGATEDVAGTP